MIRSTFSTTDGVIHQQAYRQHHRKQRQGVDGVAEQRQHAEGAPARPEPPPPGSAWRGSLQEQIHHADHEDNRLEQRLNHILHRDFDEFGAVFG